MKAFKEDIACVHANGIAIRCPGLFDGEAIIQVDEKRKLIVIVVMATNPDLELLISCFGELVQNSFPQYILIQQIHRYTDLDQTINTESRKVHYCPECIKLCFFKHGGEVLPLNQIGLVDYTQELAQVLCTIESHCVVITLFFLAEMFNQTPPFHTATSSRSTANTNYEWQDINMQLPPFFT